MKKFSSLRKIKNRDKNCVLVRRGKTLFVLNKKNKKFKAKQG